MSVRGILLSEESNPTGASFTCVSEIERLKLELAKRDRLIACIGHELRNPMTPILGQAERLRKIVGQVEVSREQLATQAQLLFWLIDRYIKERHHYSMRRVSILGIRPRLI